MATLTAQLLTVSVLALQRQMYHNRGMNRTSWYDSYDFIVVGGGTGGSVVATRLSENANVNVLLLELGPPVQETSDAISTFYFFQYTHNYPTVPQKKSCRAFNNQETRFTRGRILGGSGSVNNALYTRGNRRDFDSWSATYGAEGWDYQQALRLFLRSENNTDPAVVAANPSYHSTRGPLQVSTPAEPDPILLKWNNANAVNGYPRTDFNGPNQFGTMIIQSTQNLSNRTRTSGATAYLEPNIMRDNLHVLPYTLVSRVIFTTGSDGTPTASAVEFVRNNVTYTVRATREVIISAGTIQTPQLLMLSGIGPRGHLNQLGIPVVVDAPVGDGLQDHVMTPWDFLVTNQSDIQLSRDLLNHLTVQNMYQFKTQATGTMAQLPVSETYIASGINGDRDWPDMMCHMNINQYSDNVNDIIGAYDRTNLDAWRQYFQPIAGNQRRISLAPSIFRPRTTGTIRLASTNAADDPVIDPRFFEDQRDLMALVKGMSMCLKIVESREMRPLMEYVSIPIPGCTMCYDRPLSECYNYIACVAQTSTMVENHPCCTARMGNSSNPEAVVDARLRVMGVNNLRVVDASVMPTIPNANPNAAVFMIGERGAEMIRQDNGLD